MDQEKACHTLPDQKTTVILTVQSADGLQSHQIPVRRGMPFQGIAALHSKEVALEFDCRKADCGICLFVAVGGDCLDFLSPPTSVESDYLKAMGCTVGERLGCQTRMLASGTVRLIPA